MGFSSFCASLVKVLDLEAAFHIFTALYPFIGQYLSLRENYGPVRAIILLFIFPDAREVIQRIEEHILRSRGEEAMVMKKLLMEDCTMLAVAAAIVAQIAITALSLDGLNDMHWTCRASFVVTLVSGALSVFFACLLQQQMSALFGPEDVKDWLSIQAGEGRLVFTEQDLLGYAGICHRVDSDWKGRSEELTAKAAELEEIVEQMAGEGRWYKASINAAFMIKSPVLLLKGSVGAFLIGLGIYLGYVWTGNLDQPQSRRSSLNVLIVYVVVTAAGLLLFYIPRTLKNLEKASIRRWEDLFAHRGRTLGRKFSTVFSLLKKEPMGRRDMLTAAHVLGTEIRELVSALEEQERAHANPGFVAMNQQPFHAFGCTEGIDGIQGGSERLHQGQGFEESWDLGSATGHSHMTVSSDGDYGAPGVPRTNDKIAGGTLRTSTQEDPLLAALEATIKAQEQSTTALRAALEVHRGI